MENKSKMKQRETLMTSSIRLSPEQRKLWEKESLKAGYNSMAEFVRATVDQQIKIGGPSKSDIQDLTTSIKDNIIEIRRLENSLHDIVRKKEIPFQKEEIDSFFGKTHEVINANIDLANSIHSVMFRRVGGTKKLKNKKKDN